MTITLHAAPRAAGDGDPPRPRRRAATPRWPRRPAASCSTRSRGSAELERILLKAAAGAGKSYVLKQLVADAVDHPTCLRVAVIAFQNRQLWPLAAVAREDARQGPTSACSSSKDRYDDVPDDVHAQRRRSSPPPAAIPDDVRRRSSPPRTSSGRSASASACSTTSGPAPTVRRRSTCCSSTRRGSCPHHLFDKVAKARADRRRRRRRRPAAAARDRHQPVARRPGLQPLPRVADRLRRRRRGPGRAELPAVWRPAAAQLPLWRAFYPEWGELDCVAAPGDRVDGARRGSSGVAAAVWEQVATGVPGAARGRRARGRRGRRRRPAADRRSSSACSTSCSPPASRSSRRATTTPARPTASVERWSPGDDPTTRSSRSSPRATRPSTTPTDAVERLREKHGLTETGPRRLHRRLLAGPDERHHRRDPPAHRRVAARRVQLGVRPPRRDLHARHPRAARGLAARPRPAARRSARPARHAVRRARQPPPAAPDPPTHPRHVRAWHCYRHRDRELGEATCPASTI